MFFVSVSSYGLHLNMSLPSISLSAPLKERLPIPVVKIQVIFPQVLASQNCVYFLRRVTHLKFHVELH